MSFEFLSTFLSSSVRSLAHSAQRTRGKTLMVPCDTEYPAFVSERTIKETTGNIDCEGCIRYPDNIAASETVNAQPALLILTF